MGASDSSGAGGSSGGDSGVIAGDDIGDIIFGAGGNGVNDDGVDSDGGESYCENGEGSGWKEDGGPTWRRRIGWRVEVEFHHPLLLPQEFDLTSPLGRLSS